MTFFDGLVIPGSGPGGKVLWPDVITVHHPDYYQASGDPPPPADWDDPTPIPFLTAAGDFLIALGGPKEWVEAAFKILGLALKNEGIGAKTSSGYGRMEFVEAAVASSASPAAAAVPQALQKRELLHAAPKAGYFRGTVVDLFAEGRLAKINPAEGGQAVKAHISQVKPAGGRLLIGQVVEYRLGIYKGEEQAQDVSILLEP